MSPLAAPAHDLNWLITNFADRVPSVAHAIVVSADGLPLAFSSGFPQDRADQLAAVTSGLTKLVQGAARIFSGGPVAQAVVVMEQGTLIMMSLSGNSVLAVLATPESDLGNVAYEMSLLGERAGPSLDRVTPRAWWRSYRRSYDSPG